MALAKTRRFACIVALGAVIRGETPHFDFVAGEAASGLQLSALETVCRAFGVLTTDTTAQAEARVDKGAEAVRAALEMADLFSQLRASARRARYTGRRDGQGLRSVREEAELREQPEPLDGRHQAPLRPERPASG